jgi:hypothetical protein
MERSDGGNRFEERHPGEGRVVTGSFIMNVLVIDADKTNVLVVDDQSEMKGVCR